MADPVTIVPSPKFYGKELNTYTEDEQVILTELMRDKQARQWYEPMWQEWNYAYQAVLFEYSMTRKFNEHIDPALQVRRMFTDKDRQLSDYRLPVEFAIIIRQIADEMSNLPRAHWVSLTQNLGSRDGKSKIFNYIYDWNYYEIDGDLETFKTLLAKAIYGTAVEYIFHEYKEYPDYEVSGVDKDGNVEYTKIKRVISRSRFRNIDIRKFFVDSNATDIREAEHCFIVNNYGDATTQQMFRDTTKWDIKGIKPMQLSEAYISIGEMRRGNTAIGYQHLIYFNSVNNCVVHFLNGKKINKKEMHIPIPSINGKPPLPVAIFYDSPLDKEFYGIGKCATLKPFREVKNKLRNAFFDVTKKMAFSTLIVDPDSDFDEETYIFGTPFVRAVPDDIKPLPVTANLQPLIELDNKTDQDMIWATGINFLDTAQGNSTETATKTAVRKESQVKIVELGLKYNGVDGFKRRALLLKQLLRLHLKSATVQKIQGTFEPLTIKTQGVQLKRGKGNVHKIYEEKTNTFGLFKVLPKDLEDDCDLLLEQGNIAATRELKKARQMEAAQQIVALQPAPQGAELPYDQKELVKFYVEWGELPSEILPAGSKSISDIPMEDVINSLNLISKPPTHDDIIKQQTAQDNQGGGVPGQPAASTTPDLQPAGPPGLASAGGAAMPLPGPGAR